MIDDVFAEVRVARDGRAKGSIIGRNASSCPKSGRSSCSTRYTSTRVELLAAAQDAGELAVHQDAGEVRLGAGVVALVVAEDLLDLTVDLHRSVARGGRLGFILL